MKHSNAKNNVLILGSSGLLGSALVNTAPRNTRLFLAYRKNKLRQKKYPSLRIDLGNIVTLKKTMKIVKPALVIHASRIEPYENNPKQAKKLIASLIQSMKPYRAKIVYISTEAVFDGKRGNYSENDMPQPITLYGRAKHEAEKVIQKQTGNYMIIRTSYIYGKKRNGLDERTKKLFDEIKKNGVAFRFQDIYRSPINAQDLAQAIWKLVRVDFQGIIHIANKRQSIFQFSKMLVQRAGYKKGYVKPNLLKNSLLRIPRDTSLNTALAKKIIQFVSKE